MRLRYSGLLSWKLFSGPKPVWRSGFNNARIRVPVPVMQTRMVYIVPPPVPPSPSFSDQEWVVRVHFIVFRFNVLFRGSPPDLTEQLMSTIIQYPGVDRVTALSCSLYKAKSLDPSIRSVVQVLHTTADIMVKRDSHFDTDEPLSFRDAVKISITHILWGELFLFRSEQATDTITDRVLHAALFSASAVKNGLLDEDFIYDFTRFGLLLSDSESLDDDNEKMCAVMRAGACLQLITAGSLFMEKHFAKAGSLADFIAALEALIAVLEALRDKRSIAYPRGLELLEKTIEAAKSNFANPLSASDAWKILYPD